MLLNDSVVLCSDLVAECLKLSQQSYELFLYHCAFHKSFYDFAKVRIFLLYSMELSYWLSIINLGYPSHVQYLFILLLFLSHNETVPLTL